MERFHSEVAFVFQSCVGILDSVTRHAAGSALWQWLRVCGTQPNTSWSLFINEKSFDFLVAGGSLKPTTDKAQVHAPDVVKELSIATEEQKMYTHTTMDAGN